MAADREQEIRERAYAIWLDQGCVDGRDEQHWLEAEREVGSKDAGDTAQRDAPKPSGSTSTSVEGAKAVKQ